MGRLLCDSAESNLVIPCRLINDVILISALRNIFERCTPFTHLPQLKLRKGIGLDTPCVNMTTNNAPQCKKLVLDAGPLLSLSPLRGLAETYVTVPQVLAELKDSRAREHFERLGLLSGVKVEVRSPDAASLAHGAH